MTFRSLLETQTRTLRIFLLSLTYCVYVTEVVWKACLHDYKEEYYIYLTSCGTGVQGPAEPTHVNASIGEKCFCISCWAARNSGQPHQQRPVTKSKRSPGAWARSNLFFKLGFFAKEIHVSTWRICKPHTEKA